MASLTNRVTRLPRATQRILAILGFILITILLVNLTRTPSSGIWDASSVHDRRVTSGGAHHPLDSGNSISSSSPLGFFQRLFFKPRKPKWLQNANSIPPYLSHGPIYSRLNRTSPRRTQRGISRVVIPGSNPEIYDTGPLPSIEEAMAHLKPRLVQIKEENPSVPREHELWSPIFPPFLTKDQQERFLHLKAEWDEGKGEWVEVERRWMMVTVCRQVAGE